jgi:hypothetical protein
MEIDQVTTALGVPKGGSITKKIIVVSTLPPLCEVIVDC